MITGLILSASSLYAQEQQANPPKYTFTLEDVIRLAKEQSPQAIMARHRFRASYYLFRSYKADFLPKLVLNTNPFSYEHSIRTIEIAGANDELMLREVSGNTLRSDATLSLNQKVGPTGGTVSLRSNFARNQNLNESDSDRETQYTTTPVSLSVSQPLNGYNELKWNKKIEPLRYREAQLNYIVQMETVSSRAVNYFYALATAQIVLNMEKTNYANSKELYEISKGRYNMGTIAEDALLQMELRFMQAEGRLNKAEMDIRVCQSELRSFLGFKENVDVELLISSDIPDFKVPFDKALEYALEQSPEIISYNRQVLEAEREVARAKSQKGVNVNLGASFGLNKTGYKFKDAYSPVFDDQERVSIGITIPILDWHQQKDTYRQAQSSLEVVVTEMEQAETDFRQQIYLEVMQFNMQENQLRIAAKADTIAQKSYEVSRQRYLIGKVSVTDLNIADSDKDSAKKSYVDELRTYWNYYYTIRRLTLFDFLVNKPLEENFDSLIVD
jgi:outer membrane protein TolC